MPTTQGTLTVSLHTGATAARDYAAAQRHRALRPEGPADALRHRNRRRQPISTRLGRRLLQQARRQQYIDNGAYHNQYTVGRVLNVANAFLNYTLRSGGRFQPDQNSA